MVYLLPQDINRMGFAAVGQNVLISDKASFYNSSKISIGSNVRIDDFCVISAGVGGIFIGNYIHIAVYSSLIGAGKITIGDFSNISSRVSIYSSNDDYSGKTMTNPLLPKEFTGITNADVFIEKHVIIGSGSIILPGIRLEAGVAIGAHSLVKNDCHAFGMYAGNPVRFIKDRSRNLLELEKAFLKQVN